MLLNWIKINLINNLFNQNKYFIYFIMLFNNKSA